MPEPNCIVRRWANSEPRNTRRETIDRYSSFFRKSESNKGIALRDHFWLGDGLHNLINHRIRGYSFSLPLEIQYQSMPQNGRRHHAQIFLGHMVPMVENRPDFSAQNHR